MHLYWNLFRYISIKSLIYFTIFLFDQLATIYIYILFYLICGKVPAWFNEEFYRPYFELKHLSTNILS